MRHSKGCPNRELDRGTSLPKKKEKEKRKKERNISNKQPNCMPTRDPSQDKRPTQTVSEGLE